MLATALLFCFVASCADLQGPRKIKPDDDPAVRVEPVGGGTLVVRSSPRRARVGLISLDTGERHVLELEHPCEEAPGSFAGPDAQGRYAYVTYSRALERSFPVDGTGYVLDVAGAGLLTRALVGAVEATEPDPVELYRESWRTKRIHPKGSIAHWLVDPEPTRIVIGELGRPGERVLVSRHPADLLQSLLALAPSSGELAFFVFDFDAAGAPVGLHLEIRDLDGGEPRRFPLGRVYLDVQGKYGPGLAWLGDERHLLFKRDIGVNDTGGIFELEGDWNGHPGGRSAPPATADDFHPLRTGFVSCVLDTQTGEWHDVDQGPYGWPTGGRDEFLASNGKQLWLVHAASGASELLREIGPDSPLRSHGERTRESALAIVAVEGPERILALCPADRGAALPRSWSMALQAEPMDLGLQLVSLGEESGRNCVPRLSCSWIQLANGRLPAGMPFIRRKLARDDD